MTQYHSDADEPTIGSALQECHPTEHFAATLLLDAVKRSHGGWLRWRA